MVEAVCLILNKGIIMGWKLTYMISRDMAIKVILSGVYRLSNKELSSMLESFEEASLLRNYVIFEDFDFEREDFNIKSVEEFFNPS